MLSRLTIWTKRACCTALLLLIAPAVVDAQLATPVVQLNVAPDLPRPAQHAVDYLESVVKERGLRRAGNGQQGELILTIGLPDRGDALSSRLAAVRASVPEPAESLLIVATPSEILVSGRDARGLAYGIYEVAESIRCAPKGADLAKAVRSQKESPFLAVRSMQTQLFNHDVEKGWYESEAYWRWFFGMMARNRLNAYTITFGHNTNYMVPPYAWLFEVPGYPDVRVKGVSEEQRSRNLANFQMIGRLAQEYGVDLNVGLWTQLPAKAAFDGISYGESAVENIPPGEAGGDYAAKGLRKLLELCPGITGVQLRMNLESGIPHNKQESYYQNLFTAMAAAGRPVKLDLRYKSLSQKTIDLAVKAGLDVNVSTKYWCEHLGLPFHPTAQDPAYSASRYGYGTMLRKPRNYSVTYRLWNVGSSRLLLWGDPDYAARFARSCTLGNGEGFELLTPLANKGYGNEPGDWRIFKDPSLEFYKWEYERYWPWFLTMGRWGYNPDTSVEVWTRELATRFGPASAPLAVAYRNASQVLPLITATTLPSANNWRYWPEMLPSGHIDAYRATPPSDYGQFYAIAPFPTRPPALWRTEDWAARHSAFVEDSLANNVNPKWTPIQVSNRLDELADATTAAVNAAKSQSPGVDTAEFRGTVMDMSVLAELARYHAAKKRAATDLEFFRLTKDTARLTLAWQQIQKAQAAWEAIVTLTDGAYADQLVFGFSETHRADYPNKWHNHAKHWKDWQAEVDADVKYVADLMEKNGVDPKVDADSVARSIRRYPGETPLPQRPVIEHEPVKSAAPGQPIVVRARVTSKYELREVSVHFREMDQTKAWRRLPMTRSADGFYVAQIPGDQITGQFDTMYYIVARVDGGGAFWPDWQQQDPYVAVRVAHE